MVVDEAVFASPDTDGPVADSQGERHGEGHGEVGESGEDESPNGMAGFGCHTRLPEGLVHEHRAEAGYRVKERTPTLCCITSYFDAMQRY